MSTSPDRTHASAQKVSFSEDCLSVDLQDGRQVSVPLAWFPRLLHASWEQRGNWKLLGEGEGIHWPDVDEDISVEGLLLGIPSIEARRKAEAG